MEMTTSNSMSVKPRTRCNGGGTLMGYLDDDKWWHGENLGESPEMPGHLRATWSARGPRGNPAGCGRMTSRDPGGILPTIRGGHPVRRGPSGSVVGRDRVVEPRWLGRFGRRAARDGLRP